MKHKHSALIIIIVVLLSITSCSSPTIKLSVSCSKNIVNQFIKELDAAVEKWNDTYVIATSTESESLGPVISELQAVKRDVAQLESPECGAYIRDSFVTAMESGINYFVSNWNNEADYESKLSISKAEWMRAIISYENFKISPEDAYRDNNETKVFDLPKDWTDYQFPNSTLIISLPQQWSSPIEFGSSLTFLKIVDGKHKGDLLAMPQYKPKFPEQNSVSEILAEIQKEVDEKYKDSYEEVKLEAKNIALNIVYIHQYTTLSILGDFPEEHMVAYVNTPENEQVKIIFINSRGKFTQEDLSEFYKILGSVRNQN